jgi:hypothetical protein
MCAGMGGCASFQAFGVGGVVEAAVVCPARRAVAEGTTYLRT